MDKRFARLVEQLKRLNLWIHHRREQAEAKLGQLNDLLRQLGRTGLLAETVILGPVIHHRAYAPRAGGNDSGQIIQAVLAVPGGLGVVLWDSEEYATLSDAPDGLAAAAANRVLAFEGCEPAMKALLLPHIEPLLEELFQRLQTG